MWRIPILRNTISLILKAFYVEYARFYAGRSLYESVPDTRLDQSSTMAAVKEFQDFLDYYPYTHLKDRTQEMIFALQDKMVEKSSRPQSCITI